MVIDFIFIESVREGRFVQIDMGNEFFPLFVPQVFHGIRGDVLSDFLPLVTVRGISLELIVDTVDERGTVVNVVIEIGVCTQHYAPWMFELHSVAISCSRSPKKSIPFVVMTPHQKI